MLVNSQTQTPVISPKNEPTQNQATQTETKAKPAELSKDNVNIDSKQGLATLPAMLVGSGVNGLVGAGVGALIGVVARIDPRLTAAVGAASGIVNGAITGYRTANMSHEEMLAQSKSTSVISLGVGLVMGSVVGVSANVIGAPAAMATIDYLGNGPQEAQK